MIDTNFKSKQQFTAQQRLQVLELAEKIGNVSEACRQSGMDRASFYKWQKRYSENKAAGLTRKPRSSDTYQTKITGSIEQQVIHWSLGNPAWGCCKITPMLKKMGINISSPTVQAILQKHNLGSVKQRLFQLEEKHLRKGLKITPANLKLIIKNNPCVKEVGKTGSYPGEVLVQDTFSIFNLLPNTYIHVVIDTYSAYAFAYPSTEKSASAAVALLQTRVLKFLAERGLEVGKIITDRGYEFTRYSDAYTNFLNTHDIDHEIHTGTERNWNGFIERYKQNFFQHFATRIRSSTDLISMSDAISRMKNDGLNSEKYAMGYPAFGLRPIDLIDRVLKKYPIA